MFQPSEEDELATKTDIAMSGECTFKHRSWRNWALDTARKIGERFESDGSRIHRLTVLRVTRVKSYGPRVSHLVLDLECRPR